MRVLYVQSSYIAAVKFENMCYCAKIIEENFSTRKAVTFPRPIDILHNLSNKETKCPKT